MFPNRRWLAAFALLLLLACSPALAAEEGNPENQPSDIPGFSIGDLRRFADRVQRTGLGPDKIPALNKPEFASISDANLSMENNEYVFVVQYKENLVHIYPQRIMVWHEVVNEVLPDAEGNMPSVHIYGAQAPAVLDLQPHPLAEQACEEVGDFGHHVGQLQHLRPQSRQGSRGAL